MRETEDRWRGITASVVKESPGSHRYHVDFRVARLAQAPAPAGGDYLKVPDELRVIIERVADGELRVAQYTPPECETPGELSPDWQGLAVEAVEKHLAGAKGGGVVSDTLDILGAHGDLEPGVSASNFPAQVVNLEPHERLHSRMKVERAPIGRT